jgi:hypothetical protein
MVRDDINIGNEIDRLPDQRPFRPLAIATTRWERHEPTRQNAAALGESAIVLASPERRSSIDLRLNQIVSIEVPEHEL